MRERERETRFRKRCSPTLKVCYSVPFQPTSSIGESTRLSNNTLKRQKKKNAWWNIKCTWAVWLMANLIAVSTLLLWSVATSVLTVIEWNLFCWARPPIHSNCQSDDLCYSDSFLIYGKKKKTTQGLIPYVFFWLCKEPSAASSHLIISKHTLASQCISSPQANTLQ